MLTILLYWFAAQYTSAQQQTSTLRRQKIGFFYVKFSAEFNGLNLFFYKQQEVVKKWLKLKWSGKTPIGVVRRLRVKRKMVKVLTVGLDFLVQYIYRSSISVFYRVCFLSHNIYGEAYLAGVWEWVKVWNIEPPLL